MAEKYIDEALSPFFTKVGIEFRRSFLRGQVYWTHTLYSQENLEFWRPKDYDDETKTAATYFTLTSSSLDAFRRKAPLYIPKLEIDEEFIAVRAKRRPVILIAPAPVQIDIKPIRGGGKIHRNLCIVAPLYSVEDKEGNAKYPLDFVNRTRMMEFPNLLFVPSSTGILRNSICRLDSIQTTFVPHLEAVDLRLVDEVVKVFLGQVEFYMTGSYRGDYQVYRESLISES